MSDFNSIKKVTKSRKKYRCGWCDQLINVGDPYTRISGVYEGDFSSDPMHTECHNAWERTDWKEFESYQFGENERGKAMQEVSE